MYAKWKIRSPEHLAVKGFYFYASFHFFVPNEFAHSENYYIILCYFYYDDGFKIKFSVSPYGLPDKKNVVNEFVHEMNYSFNAFSGMKQTVFLSTTANGNLPNVLLTEIVMRKMLSTRPGDFAACHFIHFK